MKVLIIQQKMIGDVLASSILFKAIKSEHPDSELHYLVNKGTEAVLLNNPYIDKITFFDPEKVNSFSKLVHFAKSLNQDNYDVVIDIYGKLSSNILSWKIDAPLKISKRKWYTKWIYTHTVDEHKTPKTTAGLAIENRLALLGPLGITIEKPIAPKIYLSEKETKAARINIEAGKLFTDKPIFMIALLGSSTAKTYPAPYIAQLIDFLVQKTSANIVLNYMPFQQKEADEIIELLSEKTKSHICSDLFSKGLRDFLVLTSACDALIGNEGGATNMAKALGVSTFTIFSPWINKQAWNMFEDGKKHVSVHLEDYFPEHYQLEEYKKLKSKSATLYEKFDLDLFRGKLESFLAQF